MRPHALVLAKAPFPGRVKTRLGRDIGMDQAAAVAAAALLDTLDACTAAFGADHCHLALDGDLSAAVDGPEIRQALDGWTVSPQRGDTFAERLAHAHAVVAAAAAGPVVQIGMDTPQVTPDLLRAAAAGLGDPDDPDGVGAVLGRALDGGWWVLALHRPQHAHVLVGVEMSTPHTYDDTLAALTSAGVRVGATTALRDVDTVQDADAVARVLPDGRFARVWTALGPL